MADAAWGRTLSGMRNRNAHLLVAVLILVIAWALLPFAVALIVTAIVLLSFLGYL